MTKMIMVQTIAICFLTFIGCAYCKGGPKGQESDEWLVKMSDAAFESKSLMERNGFHVIAKPFPGLFVVNESIAASLRTEPVSIRRKNVLAQGKIEYMERLRYLDMRTKISVSDSSWNDMWYINPTHGGSGQSPSMNVYEAWQAGMTGTGVHVNVLDDGVEPGHSDLSPNYVSQYSYDYLASQSSVSHSGSDSHGTNCAGIIAAAKNTECVIGIAHGGTFSAVKILSSTQGLTDYDTSEALNHELANTDIYSNSWGPSDDGSTFSGPGTLTEQALKNAVDTGRGGKGAIFTWANGNGGGNDDDCNCDGYSNSIYTIAVTSLGRNKAPSGFSETCSSVFVATYGGSSGDLNIATTDVGNTCTDDFIGTSAACPVGAGILALVLQARSALTWRDVQHLIVETASQNSITSASWLTNGAGKQVSHKVGFGLMNANAMVTKAPTWDLVPAQVKCESDTVTVSGVTSSSMSTDDCGISFLEHVQVIITFYSDYRGGTEITLRSPQGTTSELLHYRSNDYSYSGDTTWKFMTVMSWGENPVGTWSLSLNAEYNWIDNEIKSWQLIQYGTAENPVTDANLRTEEEDSGGSTGAIVGGVVGGIAVAGAVGGVAFFLIKKVLANASILPI